MWFEPPQVPVDAVIVRLIALPAPLQLPEDAVMVWLNNVPAVLQV
jgi:hypothetical protein